MRNAGAIPIGRTCLPDFGIGWHTDSELWGATINPWDRSRTPGASSGGEAAALATGMAPLGLGNDTLG
ncbi:MAG TPA: amidase family protein [Pseudonocardiaceae bacterium]